MLEQKKIILAISGSIAAYKTATLVRLLVKQGAEVKVIMTPAATAFITPLTLSTLSKNPVLADVATNSSWNNHVELALWADVLLIAPASANTLAKMANGLCDNLLLATYLSAKCPVLFAPAMDLDMWEHPTTQRNIQLLSSFPKHQMIPVGDGELASGLIGKGRMSEPEEIVAFVDNFFASQMTQVLAGKTILMTSGGTIEPIDPVRYITNHSTGKMGAAIAEQCARLGAKVIFINGGQGLKPKHPNVQIVAAPSANEMFLAAKLYFPTANAAILAAAVADYTPTEVSDKKIKKKTDLFDINLKKTVDIAAFLGQNKSNQQLLIGFALETNNAVENAQKKIINKNLDFIVLNTLEDAGAGFGHDTNKVYIIDKQANIDARPLQSKNMVAKDIVNKLISLF
jgi:phosphopantothenoylcysteine decarboxylase / phosphopantothenate---cysteine ligase